MSMIRNHIKAWESVPRAAAEDLRLSVSTRGVLFWLLTRPADWQVRIGAMMRLTGITKNNWPKIRDELIAAGYLLAKKGRAAGGKITWNFDVYSVSIISTPSPDFQVMVKRGMANKPSPDLPSMVLPSMVNQVTTDTVITETVSTIRAKAHTAPPTPGGQKEKQNPENPEKGGRAIARLVMENPGVSIKELRLLSNRLFSQSDVSA